MSVVVAETVLEVAAPLNDLGAALGTAIGLSIVLFKDGLVVQRLPEEGEIVVELGRAADVAAVSA